MLEIIIIIIIKLIRTFLGNGFFNKSLIEKSNHSQSSEDEGFDVRSCVSCKLFEVKVS